MNIVILEDGSWVHFDQEWHSLDRITPSFILFRAVLYLYWDNKAILTRFCKEQKLQTGWQFVEYCLGRILYTGEIDLPNFVKLEDKIQLVVSQERMFSPVEQLLNSEVESRPQTWSWEQTSLVWGKSDSERSLPVSVQETDLGLTIHFSLPVDACDSSFLQFHLALPESEIGTTFALHGVTFWGVRGEGDKTCVFPVNNTASFPPLIKLTGISFYENVRGGVYAITEKEPQVLHFVFPDEINCDHYSAHECQVTIEFLSITLEELKKEHYKLEKQNLDVALSQSINLVTEKTDEIILRDKLIAEKNNEIHALFAMAEERKHRLQEIEESRAWRVITKSRSIITKIRSLIGRGTSSKYHNCTTDDCSGYSLQREENIVASPDIRKPAKGSGRSISAGRIDSESQGSGEEHASRVNRPVLSIIIATFNTLPAYLQETLDTLLFQSFTHWELIIVDNGSSNGSTLEFLGKINHSNIKVHREYGQDNLTQAMDSGVRLSSGDWLIFLGHYDRLRPEALTALSPKIQEQNGDLLFWDEAVIDRSGATVNTITKQQVDTQQIPAFDIVGNSICVRKSLFLQAGGLDTVFDGVHFFEFVLRAQAHNSKTVYVNEVLSETRQFDPPSAGEQESLQELRLQAWEKNVPASRNV
jgi:hypothetical protein